MPNDLSGLLWGMKRDENKGTVVELTRGESGLQVIIAAHDCKCSIRVGQSTMFLPATWRPAIGDVVQTTNVFREGEWSAVSVTLLAHAASRCLDQADPVHKASTCAHSCQDKTACDCL